MRFLADENFNNDILRGVGRHYPNIKFDYVRVQDTELSGKDDLTVLAWAHEQKYLLLTHDITTMPTHFAKRMEHEKSNPGVLIFKPSASLKTLIDELALIIAGSSMDDWQGKLFYVPL